MSVFDIVLNALSNTFDNIVKPSPLAVDVIYRKWIGKSNYDPSLGYAPDSYEDVGPIKAVISTKNYNEYEKSEAFDKAAKMSGSNIQIIIKKSDLSDLGDLSEHGKDKILLNGETYSVSDVNVINNVFYIIEAER